MFTTIMMFEIKRRLRSISTYVYFGLFLVLAFLLMCTAGGAFKSAAVILSSGGKTFVNSPFSLNVFIALLSYFGLMTTAALMGQAIYQDFEYDTHALFFTTPIRKVDYLGGRFAAAFLVLVAIFSSIALGTAVASRMPFLDRALIGPNMIAAYVQPYLLSVIPNLLIMGALFFSLAALSRRILPVYMTSVILLIGYLIAGTLTAKIENKFLAGILDPFGSLALEHITEYWTVAEKNSRLVPLQGVLLLNRGLWLGVGVFFLALTYWKFRFSHPLQQRKARKGAEPLVGDMISSESSERARAITPVFSRMKPIVLLPRLTWLSFRETVKNVYFVVIVLAGVLFMVVTARTVGSIYGTSTYPVTYQMIDLVGGSFGLFTLIIITFYSGELVWRERDARTDQLFDALPVPTWLPFLSKLMALMLIQVLLLTVVMMSGIAIQIVKGYTHFELGLYIKSLFGLRFVNLCLLCVLAMVVQVMANHKYVGHFIMVIYFIANLFAPQLGFEHNLYRYGGAPRHTYSDMNGFGHFLTPLLWFDVYWAMGAVLLALLANLFWVRGLDVNWKWRLALVKERFGKPQRALAATSGFAFVALGGFVFYNTNVINEYTTQYGQERLSAQYEKEYKKHEHKPQPRVTDIKVAYDLSPEQRILHVRGRYGLVNKTDQPIDTIFINLNVPREVIIHELALEPAAKPSTEDRKLGFYTRQLEQPLRPRDTLSLSFDLEYLPRGFKNGNANFNIVANGTFVNSRFLPSLGYSEDRELSDDSTRRKFSLPPKERMADINDSNARKNNIISSDADWIDLETIISTSADQIALAPGYLQREWMEAGRRYFHYKSESKILNFFAILSARYKVRRDKWNDVNLEIFYHPGHEYNLDRMMKAMKMSLAYFTTNFSPYQHRQARILEFPRYQTFAQSFPNTIPYSEGIGFIAKVDPRDEDDIDYPFYVTAHEIAHQWWAHQVIGGNVQGSVMLAETLSQYSALMVMKQAYGAEQMKRFLKYELNRYLIGRSLERKKELPLIRVEQQPYIYYNKGSIIMYALQDYIGEAALNQALAGYIKAVAFQEPPYTNALEFLEHIKKVVPPHLSYLIEDMFESITLYENRAIAASYSEVDKGQFAVKLKVAAKKLKADALGKEKEVPLADLIDIGVLDEKGKPFYLRKQWIDRNQMEFTIVVDRRPAKAGIDPLNKLIDRKPDDNVITVVKQ